MVNLIYLVLTIFFGFAYWKLSGVVWDRYYTEDTKKSFLYVSKLPVAIFYPKPFFKKKNFWRGYIIYLLSWLSAGLAVYSLIKLLGIPMNN
jgi:tryptophan-rich sensory protein